MRTNNYGCGKRVFFMRHGRSLINTDNENMSYKEFHDLLLKIDDPDLDIQDGITETLPKVDVIYPSKTLRAMHTARIIKDRLSPHRAALNPSLDELVREVDFSSAIVTKEEYEQRKGLKGCRALILTRWHANQNEAESFHESVVRLNELRHALSRSPHHNILIITHGWYLRLVYLILAEDRITLKNLLAVPIPEYGQILPLSLQHPERFCNGFPKGIAEQEDLYEDVKRSNTELQPPSGPEADLSSIDSRVRPIEQLAEA